MEHPETEKIPKRDFSRLAAFAMVIGVMAGRGAFVIRGTTFLPLAGPAGTLIALLTGAAVMLVIAPNFSFVMRRSTRSGGICASTREAFGRDRVFLSSWFLCLSCPDQAI